MKPTPMIGDKVTVTDGSSDGHTGAIIHIKPTCVRIKRDIDGIEVDVWNYYIHVNQFRPSVAADYGSTGS